MFKLFITILISTFFFQEELPPYTMIIDQESFPHLAVLYSHQFEPEEEDGLLGQVVWIDDARVAVSSIYFPVQIWDIEEDTVTEVCLDDVSARQIALNKANESIACVYPSGLIQLVDIRSGILLSQNTFNVGDFGATIHLDFSSDGEFAVVTYRRANTYTNDAWTLELWNGDLSEQYYQTSSTNIGSDSLFGGVIFRPHTHQFGLMRDGLEFWEFDPNTRTIQPLWQIYAHRGDYPSNAFFNRDGNLLATIGPAGETLEESGIFIFSIDNEIERIAPFRHSGRSLTFTIQSNAIITSDLIYLELIDIQDETAGRTIGSINISEFPELLSGINNVSIGINDLAMSPNGRLLATLHNNGQVIIWGVPCEQDCE